MQIKTQNCTSSVQRYQNKYKKKKIAAEAKSPKITKTTETGGDEWSVRAGERDKAGGVFLLTLGTSLSSNLQLINLRRRARMRASEWTTTWTHYHTTALNTPQIKFGSCFLNLSLSYEFLPFSPHCHSRHCLTKRSGAVPSNRALLQVTLIITGENFYPQESCGWGRFCGTL